jgi:hypothetical protein
VMVPPGPGPRAAAHWYSVIASAGSRQAANCAARVPPLPGRGRSAFGPESPGAVHAHTRPGRTRRRRIPGSGTVAPIDFGWQCAHLALSDADSHGRRTRPTLSHSGRTTPVRPLGVVRPLRCVQNSVADLFHTY